MREKFGISVVFGDGTKYRGLTTEDDLEKAKKLLLRALNKEFPKYKRLEKGGGKYRFFEVKQED